MRLLKRLFISTLIGMAGLGSIQAEDSLVDVTAVDIPAKVSRSNVYIIQMRDDPAIAYTGDVAGYKATKPGKGQKINPNNAHVAKYVRFLTSTHNKALKAVGAKEKVYSYHYALNGFAAVLSSAQADALRARSDVVQVWQDERRQPTTDSTPDYLGLTGEGGVWDLQGKGEDIIVGIIDLGIWPEHPSFSDQEDFSNATGNRGRSNGRQNRNLAYGPPPASWHGSCQSGERFSQDDCNNKLIGARYYNAGFGHGGSGILTSEFLSARDSDGHGSHTASTAAGNEGPLNTINGEPVSGIAPRARIAVYKVCWTDTITTDGTGGGCFNSDSAAAIDQAVADGVDVINFSIGGDSTFFGSPDAIAFLFAADAGVFIATANGNDGPLPQTTGTPAGVPWVTAVGASHDNEVFGLVITVDTPPAIAGPKAAVEGNSPVQLSDTGTISSDVVLVDDGNDTDSSSINDGCEEVVNDVGGKIALAIRGSCNFSDKYNNAAAAGAIAIIVYNDGADAGRMDPFSMFAPDTTIPGVMVSFDNGDAMANETGVTATLDPSSSVSRDNRIASFSSRGPNGGAPDIIKPDVAAPGVGIIAAETMEPNADANGGVPYQKISGTSMASPHVAGVFALLKEAHPDWSAAMAKSALMTSARQDLKKTFGDRAADPFDIGAGAIVPAGAFEPGLVYDAGLFDYVAFSCGNNFQIFNDASCDFVVGLGFPTDGSDLNLASIGIADFVGSQTVTRTVTSTTEGTNHFTSVVDAPLGVDVVVTPADFDLAYGDTQVVSIEFAATMDSVFNEWTFGALTWTNSGGASDARSPIAIRPVQLDAPAEAIGTGTEGMLEFDVAFGYSGPYTASASGLVAATLEDGNVLDDPFDSFEFFGPGTTLHLTEVPPGTEVARWALFNEYTDGDDDLDLYVYYCPGGACSLVGSSGNSNSNETVTLTSPADGLYAIFVHGFATDGPDANYTLFNWLSGPDEGNMTVTGPGAATLGATETITVDWSGLDAGMKYMGAVVHDADGTISQTVITISTE
jgi:subtilisin family serine protease